MNAVCSIMCAKRAHEDGSNAVVITKGNMNSYITHSEIMVSGVVWTYLRWSVVCRISCNPLTTPSAYVNMTSTG